MSRIDIAIKITSQGAKEPFVTSPGPWVSWIRDVRDVFYQLKGYEGKFVTMLSFCPTGSLLTVIRHITGRGTDNVAAWLHIPVNCSITGDELVRLLGEVKALISVSKLDPAAINALAERIYPDTIYPGDYIPSPADGGYAFRGTDYYTMADILSEYRYQSYYSRYKCIFLIDRSDSVVPKPEVYDLTRAEISSETILLPPNAEEVQRVLGRGGYLLYDTFPFSAPVRVKRGQKLNFYACKDVFEAIPIPVEAREQVQQFSFPVDFNPIWYKKMSGKDFLVLDAETKEPVPNARISVCGIDLFSGVTLMEEQTRNVTVSVQAPGYDPSQTTVSVAVREPIKIFMHKALREYKYYVRPVENKYGIEYAELMFKTRERIDSQYVPLEGYVASRRDSSRLYYDDRVIWKWFLYGILSTLAALALCTATYFCITHFTGSKVFDKSLNKEEKNQPEVIAITETSTPIPDYGRAIKYMEEHSQWKKGEMEVIPELQGLFDAMNNLRYDQVLEILEPCKDRSARAGRLYDAVKECVDLEIGKPTPPFNKSPGDETITVDENYIRIIKNPKPPQSSQGGQGEANGRGNGKTGAGNIGAGNNGGNPAQPSGDGGRKVSPEDDPRNQG